jgi:hypothetical protein
MCVCVRACVCVCACVQVYVCVNLFVCACVLAEHMAEEHGLLTVFPAILPFRQNFSSCSSPCVIFIFSFFVFHFLIIS